MKQREQRGRGRPPKPPEERMAERIEVRADPGEKARLEKAADRAGMKLSDWIRNRLATAADAELGKRR
jgi:uncharacterized protein (DUF1778 family)